MFSKKVNVLFFIYLIGSSIVMDTISSKPTEKKISEINSKNNNNGDTDSSISSEKNDMLIRDKRAFPVLGVIMPVIGKYFGWSMAMAAAGVATTTADQFIREYITNKNSNKLIYRRRVDCAGNNYGCVQNVCWTNCGPRLEAIDWCFTTRNYTENVYELAKCTVNTDCDPCLPCAGSCMFDPIADTNDRIIAAAKIPTTTTEIPKKE